MVFLAIQYGREPPSWIEEWVVTGAIIGGLALLLYWSLKDMAR